MRKQTKEAWKEFPKCGKQIKVGYNTSGNQRYKRKEFGI